MILLVIGVLVILIQNGGQENNGNDMSLEETKEEATGTAKDTNVVADDERSEDEMEEEMMRDKNVVQYEGDNPNKADSLSGVITYAGVNDGKLVIRVNIDQYLSGGKCELTLLRDGADIYDNVTNIVANASTATCEGFDIPVSEIGGGNVGINIKLSADGREGLIRGEVKI